MLATLLLLSGCASLWDAGPSSTGEAIFPHPHEAWAEGAGHGAKAVELGADVCLQCHRDDQEPAPQCAECHPAYPHPDGWSRGKQHGDGLFGDDADLGPCLDCHDVDDSTANTTANCATCHPSWPHPRGWKKQSVHGAYALARGELAAVCGNCHGADLKGGDVGVSCTSCHEVFPHPDDWKQGDQHGVTAREDFDLCFTCHGEAGEGGAAGVSCHQCHSVFPHPAGWASGHIPAADTRGEGVCARCHEAGFGPNTMVARCATACHGGQP